MSLENRQLEGTNPKKWSRRKFIKRAFFGSFIVAGGISLSPAGKAVINRTTEDVGREVLQPNLKPQPDTWLNDNLTIAWLGHATFLINFFGTRILIDPALEDRIGISPFAGVTIGPKRYISAALKASEVGPSDLLLVSHAHMDHFDYQTIKKLQSMETTVVTAKNTAPLWKDFKFKAVEEMHWQDEKNLTGVKVRALEGKHWGARLPWNKDMEANSFLLSKNGINIFFSGDTAYTPKIKEQLADQPVDIAMFGIAAYSPKSFEAKHATPEQAWQMAEEINAKWVIPMHWGTFKLSQEPMEEPLTRFLSARNRKLEQIALKEVGATWVLPQGSQK